MPAAAQRCCVPEGLGGSCKQGVAVMCGGHGWAPGPSCCQTLQPNFRMRKVEGLPWDGACGFQNSPAPLVLL